jgi:hypothetical protein
MALEGTLQLIDRIGKIIWKKLFILPNCAKNVVIAKPYVQWGR